MALCWTCKYPITGAPAGSAQVPVGVCRNCRALTCDHHGAVDTGLGQFWCATCLPAVFIRRTGGGDGGGGGPSISQPVGGLQHADSDDSPPSLLAGQVMQRLAFQARFPEIAAEVLPRADALPFPQDHILALASERWTRITGEGLRCASSMVLIAVAVSLWAGGLPVGAMPAVRAGTEGPILRRNPLATGLLYLLSYGQSEPTRNQTVGEVVTRELRAELRRIGQRRESAATLNDLQLSPGINEVTPDEPEEGFGLHA